MAKNIAKQNRKRKSYNTTALLIERKEYHSPTSWTKQRKATIAPRELGAPKFDCIILYLTVTACVCHRVYSKRQCNPRVCHRLYSKRHCNPRVCHCNRRVCHCDRRVCHHVYSKRQCNPMYVIVSTWRVTVAPAYVTVSTWRVTVAPRYVTVSTWRVTVAPVYVTVSTWRVTVAIFKV